MKNSSFYCFTLFLFTILLIVIAADENEKVIKNAGDEEICRSDDKDSKCNETPKENAKEDEDETEEEMPGSKISSKKPEEEIPVLKEKRSDAEIEEELKNAQTEEQEYLKGSACSYCSYCKFCKLCDVDCPCEPSKKKPNCGMCKYCKYCYLCKMGCDTICQPGGLVDRFTSYVSNHLPKFNKDEVDEDIQKVKKWIDDYKEEL